MRPGKRYCYRGRVSHPKPRNAPLRPEPIRTMDPRPDATLGPRWTVDPGAMPGEPFQFLDVKGGDLETAKAALIELATDDGKVLYQAVNANGRRLGLFQTPQEAARAVEIVAGKR
nr:hypothetical protein [Nitrospirota bacterium]